ncbi:MAG: DUF371 domain-containing protein [Candidatus Bathyarchaeota archaeon]|nr:MAG: DUF371 domain-containing protein [Candidatus Bathyarchaeota archaeon]
MKRREVIIAHGHLNILATNKKTFEVTKDSSLTTHGTCIVAVKANKGADDLNWEFKRLMRKNGSRLTITFHVADEEETVFAMGHSKLPLSHPSSLVVRKSHFICGRTLAIKTNKAAGDFSRSLVKKLRNPLQQIAIILSVNAPDSNTKRQ